MIGTDAESACDLKLAGRCASSARLVVAELALLRDGANQPRPRVVTMLSPASVSARRRIRRPFLRRQRGRRRRGSETGLWRYMLRCAAAHDRYLTKLCAARVCCVANVGNAAIVRGAGAVAFAAGTKWQRKRTIRDSGFAVAVDLDGTLIRDDTFLNRSLPPGRNACAFHGAMVQKRPRPRERETRDYARTG